VIKNGWNIVYRNLQHSLDNETGYNPSYPTGQPGFPPNQVYQPNVPYNGQNAVTSAVVGAAVGAAVANAQHGYVESHHHHQHDHHGHHGHHGQHGYHNGFHIDFNLGHGHHNNHHTGHHGHHGHH